MAEMISFDLGGNARFGRFTYIGPTRGEFRAIVYIRQPNQPLQLRMLATIQGWTSNGYPAALLFGDNELTPLIVGWAHSTHGEITAVEIEQQP